MNQYIALGLCIVFIIFLLINDKENGKRDKLSLLIPLVWFAFTVLKPPSYWVGYTTNEVTNSVYIEGNPVNRAVYTVLMVIGLIILLQRKISWRKLCSENKIFIVWFVYCGVSIVWSEFPNVAIKRWLKGFGTPIMSLIILTDRNYIDSLTSTIKKACYIIIPLSILCIKYFPSVGRYYSPWGGAAGFSGITLDKNALGRISAVCVVTLLWDLTRKKNYIQKGQNRYNVITKILLIILSLWMFSMIGSATAAIAMLGGVSTVYLLTKNKFKNIFLLNKKIFFIIFIIPIVLYCLDWNFYSLIKITGHEDTFFGRTELWKKLIPMVGNPILGTGYGSFWLGDRLQRLSEIYWWAPNQAHNGYLEIYLELGLIGLLIMIKILYSTYKKSRKTFLEHYEVGRVQLCFFVMILLYNVTEAGFRSKHLIWFILLSISLNYSQKMNMPQQNERNILTLKK